MTEAAALDLTKYKAELIERQRALGGQVQQLTAMINQTVGQLNEVSGELKAVNRMLGVTGQPEAAI